jgi:hypothetical protein
MTLYTCSRFAPIRRRLHPVAVACLLGLAGLAPTKLPAATTAGNTGPASLAIQFDGADIGRVKRWQGGDPRLNFADANTRVAGVQVAPLEVVMTAPPAPAVTQNIRSFLGGANPSHELILTEYAGDTPLAVSVLPEAILKELRVLPIDMRNSADAPGALTLVYQARPSESQRAGVRPAGTPNRATVHAIPVVAIDNLAASRNILGLGEVVIQGRSAGRPGVSNLILRIRPADAAEFIAWCDAVRRGGPAQNTRALQLTYYSANLRDWEFGLRFNVFPMRVSRVMDSGEVEVELVCRSVDLVQNGGQPGAGSTVAGPREETKVQESAAFENRGDPADQGARDPKEFPRPAGLVRQSFTGRYYERSSTEEASYSSATDLDSLSERYHKAAKAAGWTRTGLNESGNTPDKRMIMMEWQRDKTVADLRLYAAKTGSAVSLAVTAKQP